MTINRKRNLVVSVEDGGTFEVVLHRVWKGSAVTQDFLGFYVLDSHRMSAWTHGLLGMTGLAGRAGRCAAAASGLTIGQTCSWAPGRALLQLGQRGSELQRGLVLARVLFLRKPVIKHKGKLKLKWGRAGRGLSSRKVQTDQVSETSGGVSHWPHHFSLWPSCRHYSLWAPTPLTPLPHQILWELVHKGRTYHRPPIYLLLYSR